MHVVDLNCRICNNGHESALQLLMECTFVRDNLNKFNMLIPNDWISVLPGQHSLPLFRRILCCCLLESLFIVHGWKEM